MKLIPSLALLLSAFGLQASPANQFLLVSDIHFNPLADPAIVPQLMNSDARQWEAIFAGDSNQPVSEYGADTVWPLFSSLVSQLKTLEPRPKLVIVTGDILAHKIQDKFSAITHSNSPDAFRSFEKKTVAFIALELNKFSGGVPIIVTLGNNDEDCGDYALQPDGPFLTDTEPAVQALAKLDAKATTDWAALGSYVAQNPLAKHHRIIALNTNYWSRRYANSCGSGPDPAPAELTWLANQLADARRHHDKVWLVYHIPPGIDGHTSSRTTQVVPFWKDGYSQGFNKLLDQYRTTIQLNLAGHTHLDDFRLIQTGSATTLVLINPAVSPNVGQNPAYRVIQVDSHAQPEDILTYYAPDVAAPKWQLEYNSRQALGLKKIDARSYESLYRQIGDSPAVNDKFKLYYSVSRPAGVSTKKAYVRSLYCATGHSDPKEFEACINSPEGADTPPPPTPPGNKSQTSTSAHPPAID